MAASLSPRDIRILAASLRFNPERALEMLRQNPEACLPHVIRIADEEKADDAAQIVGVLREFSEGANSMSLDRRILDSIPHGSPWLTEFAINLAKSIAHRLAADETKAGSLIRAEVLSELSERYEASGNPHLGRAASKESVRLFRELSTQDPEVLPKVVAALKCLAKRCSSTSDHGEAIAAATEAVEIAISIADDFTGARRFVDALDVLANRQSIAGERELALSTTMQAMALLDSFGAEGATLTEERSMVRLRQATLLTRLRRFEECLPAADEAVQLFQALAHQSPHAYAHLYLEAVELAGGCRVQLGLLPSEFLPRGEARALFEPLVAADPRRYAPRMMRYLARESAMVESDGETDEALRLAERAASLVACVSEHHANRHAVDQGHVFIHLAQLHLARGNASVAAEAVRRAIERFGAAAATQPAAAQWVDAAEGLLAQIVDRHTEA